MTSWNPLAHVDLDAPAIAVLWFLIDERQPRSDMEWEALTSEETKRANAYIQAADCRRFIAGRAMVRFALATLLDCAPGDVPLVKGAYGKPELDLEGGPVFNLSGTNGMLLLALSRSGETLGLDVEWRFSRDRIVCLRRYFHPDEQQALTASDPADAVRIWTRKEAVSKANGRGLALGFETFSVLENEAVDFRIVDLDLPDFYIGALAYPEGPDPRKITVTPWPWT